jgi:hypothetical protein
VIPAAAFGFFVALAVGIVAVSTLNRACPPAQSFEGFCSASWFDDAFNLASCICAAIAAFLFVALPAWVAPAHKRLISWLAYGTGAAITASYVLGSRNLSAFAAPACALVAGLVAVGLVWRRTRRVQSARDRVSGV